MSNAVPASAPAPASGPAPELSVVLPAYREAENLAALLPGLTTELSALTSRWEVVVVDSTQTLDDTAAVVAATPGCRVVSRRGGDEYGNAIRTGIEESRGEYVVIMDTDGSHDPAFIGSMWRDRDLAEVIIASRYIRGGRTDNPWVLVAMSKLLNLVFALVLRMPQHDVSNSFRLYRGDLLRAVPTSSMHFDIQEELLARIQWDNGPAVRVLELPFHFRKRMHGESKRSMLVFVGAFTSAMLRLWRLKRRIAKERGRAGSA